MVEDSAFLCGKFSVLWGGAVLCWYGWAVCGGELSGIIKLLLAGGLFDSIMKLEQIER